MKLVHPDLSGQLELDFNRPVSMIIESPALFSEYVQELYAQTNGDEGRFVLSEDGKELSFEKVSEMILNPFVLNLNDKKILNRLYSILHETAFGDELYLETNDMLSHVKGYFAGLEHRCDYMLTDADEVDFVALMKAFGIQIEDYSTTMVEKLDLYMKVVSGLLKKRLFILLHMNSYLDGQQREQLLMSARYNEVALLFIDSAKGDLADGEFCYIIDKDGCEIYP